MYTSINSLIYYIKCVCGTMNSDIQFDTSDAANNVYCIPLANRKYPGLTKDENNNAIISSTSILERKFMPCV